MAVQEEQQGDQSIPSMIDSPGTKDGAAGKGVAPSYSLETTSLDQDTVSHDHDRDEIARKSSIDAIIIDQQIRTRHPS